jgi:hypothetical protein
VPRVLIDHCPGGQAVHLDVEEYAQEQDKGNNSALGILLFTLFFLLYALF